MPHSWWGQLQITLCNKFVSDLQKVSVFSSGCPVFFIDKINCHNITETLLKVELKHPNHKTDLMYTKFSGKHSLTSTFVFSVLFYPQSFFWLELSATVHTWIYMYKSLSWTIQGCLLSTLSNANLWKI